MRLLHRLALPGLMLVGLIVFTLGINWGLPSRASDRFLFGEQPAWSGAEIVRLAPAKIEGGADVDVNPILDRKGIVKLNQTDAQRAEIVRRFRLFSHQPDEMITFSSLSRIRQFNGDPRLYQYGGLWVYPVGVMLKVASIMGLVELKSDQAYYLDHPDAFGRFYVVARFYSAMWGVVGVWGVYRIAKRLSVHPWVPIAAAGAFIFLPVVMNMAHEAKPHLGGCVLQLLAILAAMEFVQSRREKWFWIGAALCGAAFGMVISSLWIFVVLPIARRAHADSWPRTIGRTLLGVMLGGLVYCVTNPYVPINLVSEPLLLSSNIGNSTAMYGIGRIHEGIINAVRLIAEGTTVPLAIAGLVGVVVLLRRHPVNARILLAPTVLVGIQMMLLGAGKPAEYGRFALLLDVVIAIAGVVALSSLWESGAGRVVSCLVLIWTVFCGGQYMTAFLQDTHERTSRVVAAERIAALRPARVALPREPAPYNCPPVDLFNTRLLLLPPNTDPRTGGGWDMMVYPIEAIQPLSILQTPMSWANKDFVIVSK